MPKRRATNEGCIHHRKDGRWVAVVDLGVVDGKRKRKSYYGATQAEVKAKLLTARQTVKEGRSLPNERRTVGDFLAWWLSDVMDGTVRPTTLDGYRYILNRYVVPAIGGKSIANLTTKDVHDLLRSLERADANHRALSPATRRQVRTILRKAMDDAVRFDAASHNPVAKTAVPKKSEHRTADALTLAEARALLATVRGQRAEALVTVALTLGLRKGEALALKWSDVDLDAGTLTVNGTLKRRVGARSGVEGSGLIIDAPKTEAGRRTIPLPSVCVAALREHRTRQASDRLAAGPTWTLTGHVFTTPVGTPIDPRNVTTQYHRLTNAAGLGRRRFHALRHSAATLMLASGVPLSTISATLGHSGYAITADIYAEVGQELMRQGADAMDVALGG